MRRITGAVFISLDGVIQAPGGPEEDPSGNFALGGWLWPVGDDSIDQTITALFAAPFDLLLGRRTYEIFAAYWPYADPAHPITGKFATARKYVLCRADQQLGWQGSARLADMAALAALKAGDGPDLVIQGSATLYPQLLAAGLLDRLVLMIAPVVLGRGKRLFGAGTPPLALRQTACVVGSGGVVVAEYQPAGPVETGSFAEQSPSPAELARRARIAAGEW